MSQKNPQTRAFYQSMGDDLRRGDFSLKGTKEKLERDRAEGEIKWEQARERLQEALRRQKQHQE